MNIPTSNQVAAGLERAARLAAPVIALLITCLLLAAELAYRLGYLTGEAIHARNDQMAAAWRRLWVPEAEVLAEPAALPIPAVHPLSLLAADFEQMTCKQIRELTGLRRKTAKRELIALAVVC